MERSERLMEGNINNKGYLQGHIKNKRTPPSQAKTVTPSANWTTDQSIIPDANYDFLSEVVVKKIPYVETLNAAGGYTITIG